MFLKKFHNQSVFFSLPTEELPSDFDSYGAELVIDEYETENKHIEEEVYIRFSTVKGGEKQEFMVRVDGHRPPNSSYHVLEICPD